MYKFNEKKLLNPLLFFMLGLNQVFLLINFRDPHYPLLIKITATLLISTFVYYKFLFKKKNLSLPVGVVLLLPLTYTILGIINTYVMDLLFKFRNFDNFLAIECINLGFFSMLFGFLTISPLSKNNNKFRSSYKWDVKKVKTLLIIQVIIAFFSIIYFWGNGGFILLFSDKVSSYGQIILGDFKKVPGNSFYYASLFYLSLITGIYLVLRPSKNIIKIAYVFLNLLLLGSGIRSSVFMSVIFFFSIYYYYHRPSLKPQKILIIFIILLTVYFGIGIARSGMGIESLKDFLFYTAFATGGEFAGFSETLYYYPDGMVFDHSVMRAFIFSALPKQVWEFLGINKDIELIRISKALGTTLLDKGRVGIRIGLLGNLYLDYGKMGIGVGMYLFGLLLGISNRVLKNSSIFNSKYIHYSFILMLMAYSFFAESDLILGYFYYGIYFLGIYHIICKQKDRFAAPVPPPIFEKAKF